MTSVSLFMNPKKRQINPMDLVKLERLCWYDLGNFLNTYFPDLSEKNVEKAAKAFCTRWPGWNHTYGSKKIEKAIIQKFI